MRVDNRTKELKHSILEYSSFDVIICAYSLEYDLKWYLKRDLHDIAYSEGYLIQSWQFLSIFSDNPVESS